MLEPIEDVNVNIRDALYFRQNGRDLIIYKNVPGDPVRDGVIEADTRSKWSLRAHENLLLAPETIYCLARNVKHGINDERIYPDEASGPQYGDPCGFIEMVEDHKYDACYITKDYSEVPNIRYATLIKNEVSGEDEYGCHPIEFSTEYNSLELQHLAYKIEKMSEYELFDKHLDREYRKRRETDPKDLIYRDVFSELNWQMWLNGPVYNYEIEFGEDGYKAIWFTQTADQNLILRELDLDCDELINETIEEAVKIKQGGGITEYHDYLSNTSESLISHIEAKRAANEPIPVIQTV